MDVRRTAWFPVAVFFGVALVIGVVGWQSAHHFESEPDTTRPHTEHLDGVIGPWLQYDSGWYIHIADDGYSDAQIEAFRQGGQAAVAFFPGYPLATRAVGNAIGDLALAALLLTFLSGLAIAVLFWRWCGERISQPARTAAALLLLLYPYAWYVYGSGYADALFIASAIGAFLLVDKGHPVWAGLLAIVSTATRPTGVAVVIGLLAVALERRKVIVRDDDADTPEGASWWQRERARWRIDRAQFRAVDLAVLVSVTGLLAYMVFLNARVGDPFAFASVQEAWGHPGGLDLWLKRTFFAEVFRGDHWFWVRLVPQAVLSAACLVAVPFVGKRFGWGYGAYTFVVVVVPLLGTSSFMGTGRYMLAAFPVFALAGEQLVRFPRLRVATLVVFALALAGLSSLFTRGYYLS